MKQVRCIERLTTAFGLKVAKTDICVSGQAVGADRSEGGCNFSTNQLDVLKFYIKDLINHGSIRFNNGEPRRPNDQVSWTLAVGEYHRSFEPRLRNSKCLGMKEGVGDIESRPHYSLLGRIETANRRNGY